MRKYLTQLLLGSAMSASAFAFAAEPVAAPLPLSDAQMDVVTAGTTPKPTPKSNNSSQNVNQSNSGYNIVLGLNPAIGLLNLGSVSSGNNTGQNNTAIVRR